MKIPNFTWGIGEEEGVADQIWYERSGFQRSGAFLAGRRWNRGRQV